jgi:carbon monoxide dehydrogenase subunit G
MLRKGILASALSFLLSPWLLADFTYEQTSQITGGAMAGMIKMAGAFSKQLREPMRSTVLVKGDRMAHVNMNHVQVIDLNTETITDIDTQKKTYSVMSFAEMKEAMQRMSEKMAQKSKEQPDAQLEFKASIKNTGQTKLINGFNAKEQILTIEMGGTDAKTGQKGAMTVISDMWLAPKIAGYDEVRDFHRRMAEKIAWAPGTSGFAMGAQAGQMSKGFAELAKEGAKLEGVPVMQIVKMGVQGDGMQGTGSGASAPPQQQQQAPPPAADSGNSRMGRLGGIAGGLGGIGGLGGLGGGRKKKDQDQPPPQTANQGQGGDASGALMEMTTELTSFSSAPVDSSKFEIPAGFKKVDSRMAR